MKKILGLIFLLSSFFISAQNTFNVITDQLRIDNMIWNQSLEKFSYFEKEARHYNKVVWEFTLNNNHTGSIKVTELGDGDKYGFNIYNWEFRKNEQGQDFIWADVIQVSNSEKATIMVNSNQLKQQMVSVFMPDSRLVLFFDNMN
jgi:hypothetical protein